MSRQVDNVNHVNKSRHKVGRSVWSKAWTLPDKKCQGTSWFLFCPALPSNLICPRSARKRNVLLALLKVSHIQLIFFTGDDFASHLCSMLVQSGRASLHITRSAFKQPTTCASSLMHVEPRTQTSNAKTYPKKSPGLLSTVFGACCQRCSIFCAGPFKKTPLWRVFTTKPAPRFLSHNVSIITVL